MRTARWTRFRLLPPDSPAGWTPFAWLIYFPAMFLWPVAAHASTTVWVATIVAAAVFLPLYFRAYWCTSTREKLWIIGTMAALGMLLSPVNGGAFVLTVYAASFAGNVRPTKRAAALILLIVGAALAEAYVLHLPPSVWIWPAVFGSIVGFTNTHFATVRESNSRLLRAQEEIEQLAKVAERERIARDLHDLLGHTLSLITLKAALASKLADRDMARAIVEIRDVERISRDALTEVRAAVAGYRESGLAQQLASAASMLRAAGIELDADMAPVALSPAEETVLGLIAREAVTNVVRHAHATHCRITLAEADGLRTLCIEDDGRGKSGRDGSGITGMRERIASLGGVLTVESLPGTRVRATLAATATTNVPVDAPSTTRLSISA